MICLVTDRHRLVTGAASGAAEDAEHHLLVLVEAAAAAGVDLIQIRERDLDARSLVDLVERCVNRVRGGRTKIVVNDRTDVAIAAAAHGVHLRSDSVAPLRARSLLPASALVGRSVHSRAEVARLTKSGGVDYFIFGTMFGSASKGEGHRVSSIDELGAACRETPGTPVLAIGGMTVERAAEVVRAGASGIAAIGLFLPPRGASPYAHLRSIVESLRQVFDTCRAVP